MRNGKMYTASQQMDLPPDYFGSKLHDAGRRINTVAIIFTLLVAALVGLPGSTAISSQSLSVSEGDVEGLDECILHSDGSQNCNGELGYMQSDFDQIWSNPLGELTNVCNRNIAADKGRCEYMDSGLTETLWDFMCGKTETELDCVENNLERIENAIGQIDQTCAGFWESATDCEDAVLEAPDILMTFFWNVVNNQIGQIHETCSDFSDDASDCVDFIINAPDAIWATVCGETTDELECIDHLVDWGNELCGAAGEGATNCEEMVQDALELDQEGFEEGQEVHLTVGPVETFPVCTMDPCENEITILEGTTVTVPGVPSMDVSTPEIGIGETCIPVLFCVGPATIVPAQNIAETPPVEEHEEAVGPIVVDPICEMIPEVCLGSFRLIEEQEVLDIGVYVAVGDIFAELDPFGSPSEVGPFGFTIPNPFGGDDIPLTICPEGCEVPATVGSSLATSVTVTIWVGDEEHSQTVPIDL